MEQFSIEKYLENPSRKVVTRRGNPVRIICTDRKHGEDELPVVFLEECNGGEFLLTCKSNGRDGSSKDYDTPYDLFFADEKGEMTEFEAGLSYFLLDWIQRKDDYRTVEEAVKESSKKLLDLARKELKKKFVLLAKEDYQTAFDLGKAELLKDLPNWEKCDDNLPYSHIGGLNNRYLIKDGYCIKISDLEKLPKEE